MPQVFDVLSVTQTPILCEIDDKPVSFQVAEFWINGSPLSSLLGIERGFGSSECNLDIEELSAQQPSSNQFGTGRVVLYRCHCGSDYCGVFSCGIVDRGDSIEWQNISFEDDSGMHLSGRSAIWPNLLSIEKLVFNKEAYLSEIRAANDRSDQLFQQTGFAAR